MLVACCWSLISRLRVLSSSSGKCTTQPSHTKPTCSRPAAGHSLAHFSRACLLSSSFFRYSCRRATQQPCVRFVFFPRRSLVLRPSLTRESAPLMSSCAAFDAGEPAPKRAKSAERPEAKARQPAALAWMRSAIAVEGDVPVPFDSLSPLLNERLASALRSEGIERLFPMQATLWNTLAGGTSDAHDICCVAPTGSGKTLAYALPLVASLAFRVVRRLRALVVLPTHDLAQQVGAVLRPLCEAVGLSLAVISGKGALGPEAASLVDCSEGGVSSRIDVLVATPGRLVAHSQSTKGFTLEHLRLLVVDEVDRLLRQSYQARESADSSLVVVASR